MIVNVRITKPVLKINASILVTSINHVEKMLFVEQLLIDQYVDVHLIGLATLMTNAFNMSVK